MSADVLRRAAGLMRERATNAIPSPWAAEVLGSEGYAVMGPGVNPNAASVRLRVRRWVARIGMNDWQIDKDTAIHIASWHPDVALAVADWLDGVALFLEAKADEEYFDLDGDPIAPEDTHAIGSALTVARAYLGSES